MGRAGMSAIPGFSSIVVVVVIVVEKRGLAGEEEILLRRPYRVGYTRYAGIRSTLSRAIYCKVNALKSGSFGLA